MNLTLAVLLFALAAFFTLSVLCLAVFAANRPERTLRAGLAVLAVLVLFVVAVLSAAGWRLA